MGRPWNGTFAKPRGRFTEGMFGRRDSSGLCPFLLRKMTGREQTGGGNVS